MGVEPTKDSLMPPNGVEVREAHRDSTAPLPSNLIRLYYTTRQRNTSNDVASL